MRRLFLVLLMAFSASAQNVSVAGAMSSQNVSVNIAAQQHGSGANPVITESAAGTGSAGTATVTLGSAVTAGYRVLVVTGSNGTNNTPTMTGETFTAYTGASGCQNNVGFVVSCYLITSAVGGQTVVNCSSAGVEINCAAMVINAPQGLSPKDAGGNTLVTSASLSVATSAATTNASDLIVGMFFTGTNSITYTVGSGWSAVLTSGGSNGSLFVESLAPGSTGVQTATATASASANTAEAIIAIKP